MRKQEKPIAPVKPSGMELVFLYICPHCGAELPLLAPTTPMMTRCSACERVFPVVPVEEKSVNFIKIMLGNGVSAVDADFI